MALMMGTVMMGRIYGQIIIYGNLLTIIIIDGIIYNLLLFIDNFIDNFMAVLMVMGNMIL